MPDGQFISACWKCKCEVWLPAPLYNAAKHSSRISFFCSYGHEAIFSEGETEADKLRRERDRLVQQMAQRDDVIRQQSKELERERAAVRALKDGSARAHKRAKAGTCPCCKRTFRQVALHMRNKHPEFKAEEIAA
jgi:hypothetical protein